MLLGSLSLAAVRLGEAMEGRTQDVALQELSARYGSSFRSIRDYFDCLICRDFPGVEIIYTYDLDIRQEAVTGGEEETEEAVQSDKEAAEPVPEGTSRIPSFEEFLRVKSQAELIALEVGMNDGDFYTWHSALSEEQLEKLKQITDRYDPEGAIEKRYAYVKKELGGLTRTGRSVEADPELAEKQARASIGTLAEFYTACESVSATINLTAGVSPARKITVKGNIYLKSDGGYQVNSKFMGGSTALFNVQLGAVFRLATPVRISPDSDMSTGYTGSAFRVDGTLTLESGAMVNGFRTGSDGGGVMLQPQGTLNMKSGSLIRDCTAMNKSGGEDGSSLGYGGGIYTSTSSDLNITGGEIRNCSAARNGGGISYHGIGNSVTISGLSLHDNAVYFSADSGSGGGIFLSSSSATSQVTFQSCSIYANQAVFGGGISSRIPMVISGCKIYGNAVSQHGGGVVTRSLLTIHGGTIMYSNRAATDGSAVYIADVGNVTLSNVSIYGNTGGYGVCNEQNGTLSFKGNVNMGFTSYTNDRNFAASNNGTGNVHNYGVFYIYSGYGYCKLVCTSRYNIRNEAGGWFESYYGGGMDYPVFTGAATHAILNYGEATINSGILYDANVGMVNFGGRITISNVTIRYCKARGIHNADSDGRPAVLRMNSGNVLDNGTDGTTDVGGGIYNAGGLLMAGGNVAGNSALNSGGGIQNVSEFELREGNIYNNTQTSVSTGGGGGVGNSGSFTMTGGKIYGNASARLGGGVRNDGDFTMDTGEITSNSAVGGGGIMTGSASILTLVGGAVSGNTAADSGGGILGGGDTELRGTVTISGNKAGNQGGGIFQNGTMMLNMGNGTINRNQSGSHGGGVAVAGTVEFLLGGGIISGNQSSGTGAQAGGIFVNEQAKLSMGGGIISSNTAANAGGAVCHQSTAISEIWEGEIYGNSATADCGAVLVTKGTMKLTGGQIRDNATCGVYLYAGAMELSGGIVSGNSAVWSGGPGGVYNYNGSFTMNGGYVYGNTGCGIYNGARDGSTSVTASIKDGYIGLKGWGTDGDSSYETYAADNTTGGVYNAKKATLRFNGTAGRVYSGKTYGIRNYGTLSITPSLGAAIYGPCTYALDNNSPGVITSLSKTTIRGAVTGLWNNSQVTTHDSTIRSCSSYGINNTGTGAIQASTLTIDTVPQGINNSGTFTLNSGTIQNNSTSSVHQNGTFRISGSPKITGQIFLTSGHFVTVNGICASNLVIGLNQSDTFDGRVLANYTFYTSNQTGRYGLEGKTRGYSDAKYLEIKDNDVPTDTAYRYQVLLKEGAKVLIEYNGNPDPGDAGTVTGTMESDIVPLESTYTMKTNRFAYEEHAYTGWDLLTNPENGVGTYQEGDKVPVYSLISAGNVGLSVNELLERSGRAVTVAESEEYDYVVDLNAVWDKAPEINLMPLEFHENEKVIGKDLIQALTDSKLGATDKEDGSEEHFLDSQVKIIKIQYGTSAGNSSLGISPVRPGIDSTFTLGMADNYVMNTDYGYTLNQEETVTNRITFSVIDSAGNTTQEECNVYVKYNYAPEIRVFRNLVYTTQEVQEEPFTQARLLALASPYDLEDDLAKKQGEMGADGLIIDITRSFRLEGIQKDGTDIEVEEIRDPGTYTVTYTVTDRFGKTTVRSANILVVEPDELTTEDVRYVRFISLKYLDTLEENTKWDREELQTALEKETSSYELSLSHEQVKDIKTKMEGFGNSKAATLAIIREIADTYLP